MASKVINTYSKSIRKTIVGFGDIFNNISITRLNNDGTSNQTFPVPLIFAPKEKYITKILADPNLDKKIQITLPRMSYDLHGIEYDSTRKQNTNIKNTTGSSTTTGLAQYVPVPYNFNFSLYIYVRNIEDATEIVEKILPFFTPEYTIKINYVPEMGIVKELPILLTGVESDIEYEGESESTRVVIWTLNFTAKGFIFGAITESSIIKEVIVNLNNLNDSSQDQFVIFNMANTGFGVYKTNETVYQGYNLDTAWATAKVLEYSNTTNQLKVTNINGQFLSNTYINGFESNSEHLLNSLYNQNSKFATIDIKVNPLTANANSNYTVTTNITEY